MANLQLDVKNYPEEKRKPVSNFSYDEIAVWDLLKLRLRLFIFENRDLIVVALVLFLGFGAIWTTRLAGQPVLVGSQAAGTEGTTPAVAVTILVATPTVTPLPTTTKVSLTPSPLFLSIPTLPPAPLTPVQEAFPFQTPTAKPRPTNPFWRYLKK